MPENPARPLISLVIPCFNEESVLPHLRAELTPLLDRLARDYDPEVLLVDDGSRDRTWALIREYAEADPRFKGVSLSRNFGHQAALTCGYDWARGQAVVAMDSDLQDPPEVVEQMLEKWKGGADIVYGVRDSREGEGLFKRATASLFYRTIGALGASPVRADSGDFRLMSRRSLEALKGLPEYHRFIRGMVGWIGFKTEEVRYVRKPRRAGSTKFTLRKMVRFALDAVVSFSIVPLRLTYISAGLLSLTVLGYLVWSLVSFLFFGGTRVPGWASLILAIVAFGTMNLICLGIMGEYVGRIYEQSKNRPVYLVVDSSQKPADSPPPKIDPGGKGL
jgi:polyisoprenyl-phosphate glycosyltransferase